MTEEIKKLVDEEICRMIKEDPNKMLQYFVAEAGKQTVRSNASFFKISLYADIDGQRYKITTKTTAKKIQNLTATLKSIHL